MAQFEFPPINIIALWTEMLSFCPFNNLHVDRPCFCHSCQMILHCVNMRFLKWCWHECKWVTEQALCKYAVWVSWCGLQDLKPTVVLSPWAVFGMCHKIDARSLSAEDWILSTGGQSYFRPLLVYIQCGTIKYTNKTCCVNQNLCWDFATHFANYCRRNCSQV